MNIIQICHCRSPVPQLCHNYEKYISNSYTKWVHTDLLDIRHNWIKLRVQYRECRLQHGNKVRTKSRQLWLRSAKTHLQTREENILAISHVNSNSHYTHHQNPSTVISYQHRLVAPPTPHTETASISYIIIIFIVILFMNFPAAKDIRNSCVYITA
jgi:hypothetical protein